MPDVSFSGLVVVCVIAFVVPLALGMLPRIPVPAVVLEIVCGIVVGPSMLGWVRVDLVIQVLAVIGLALLLFLAGLEVDPGRLRGRSVRLAGYGFVVSLAIALALGAALHLLGQVRSPLFIAILLSATSLGLVVPVLKDAGMIASGFGQLVVAGATIADFAAVILLSLFFGGSSGALGAKLVLLGSFLALLAAIGLAVAGASRSNRLTEALRHLQDTTAQIRVRGAVLLLIGFVAIAERFGLETILGAFVAGVILRLIDRDEMLTHPTFRTKLEAIGYGFFVPVFFIASGLRFDVQALFSGTSTLVRVPVFLVALLAVRGLPALLYRREIGSARGTVAAGLLQATSLPFIVAATGIGIQLGEVSPGTGAALIAAGLLSVVLFPPVSLSLLRGRSLPLPMASRSESLQE